MGPRLGGGGGGGGGDISGSGNSKGGRSGGNEETPSARKSVGKFFVLLPTRSPTEIYNPVSPRAWRVLVPEFVRVSCFPECDIFT